MSVLDRALAMTTALFFIIALALGASTWYFHTQYREAASELARVTVEYNAFKEGIQAVQEVSASERRRGRVARERIQGDPEVQAWAEQPLPEALVEALK